MTEPTSARARRLDFSARCVAEVFPGVRDPRETKATIFDAAARWGVTQDDCPASIRTVRGLRTYIRNKWKVIRLMLPTDHDILPCYVNGPTFGGGGGYRKGNIALARKQVERDAKIADGVVTAANDFAEATVGMFPQVEAPRRTLVTRRIG